MSSSELEQFADSDSDYRYNDLVYPKYPRSAMEPDISNCYESSDGDSESDTFRKKRKRPSKYTKINRKRWIKRRRIRLIFKGFKFRKAKKK